jgi:tetratricopeptide (TPR) repeat protein
MKKGSIAQFFYGLVVLAIIGGGIYLLYQHEVDKKRYDLASRLSEFGPRKATPRDIDELKRAIATYQYIQEQHVKDAAQTGVYWKLLGIRFQEKQMYFEAIDALEQAIRYAPNEPVLHYLLGLNAGQAAKSTHTAAEMARYFEIAESAYKRTLDLEPTYTQARYALAILYIYELNRPQEGIDQLTRYMEGRSGDADAMMVMARALYMTGQNREAIEWYDKAIPLTKDPEKKREAEANRYYIMGL